MLGELAKLHCRLTLILRGFYNQYNVHSEWTNYCAQIFQIPIIEKPFFANHWITEIEQIVCVLGKVC